MVTLNEYVTGAVQGKKAGLSEGEIARKLGVDMKELKMWKEDIGENMTYLVVQERFSLESAAGILGIPKNELGDYCFHYGLSLSPGRELGERERNRRMNIMGYMGIDMLDIPARTSGAVGEEAKYLARQREIEAERQRLAAGRQMRQEVRKGIESCVEKGIRTRKGIARELGIGLSIVYYLTKGDKRIIGRAETNAERIREAIRAGARYKDEVAEITGLNQCTVRNLSKRFKLGVKRRTPGRKPKEYTLDSERDYLIISGCSLPYIARVEGVTVEAIRQYILRSGQYERWKNTRTYRKKVESSLGFRI